MEGVSLGSAADACNRKACKTAIVGLCREPQIACLLVHSFSKGFAVQIRSRAGTISCAFIYSSPSPCVPGPIVGVFKMKKCALGDSKQLGSSSPDSKRCSEIWIYLTTDLLFPRDMQKKAFSLSLFVISDLPFRSSLFLSEIHFSNFPPMRAMRASFCSRS